MRRTKKATYRVIVIGCGKVGALYEKDSRRPKPASHAGVAAVSHNTKLVALVDTNPKALTRAGELFPQAAQYRSVRACLTNERPDIAVISTPPSARLAIIRECLKACVRAIVCEKPLATTTFEARAIERAIAKSNTAFVLNYQRRFSPLVARVRKDITSGTLGKIQQVTCYYSNGLYNNGGHALDTLLYLLGEKLTVRWARVNPRLMHPSGDPCVDAILETKSGARIVLQSVDQRTFGIFDIRIFGTEGERALLDNSDTLIETDAHFSSYEGERTLDRTRTRTFSGASGHALLQAVLCLKNKKRSASNAENGRAVVELLEQIHVYAQKNK